MGEFFLEVNRGEAPGTGGIRGCEKRYEEGVTGADSFVSALLRIKLSTRSTDGRTTRQNISLKRVDTSKNNRLHLFFYKNPHLKKLSLRLAKRF